jgi:hypothetical protein
MRPIYASDPRCVKAGLLQIRVYSAATKLLLLLRQSSSAAPPRCFELLEAVGTAVGQRRCLSWEGQRLNVGADSAEAAATLLKVAYVMVRLFRDMCNGVAQKNVA